MKKWILLSAAVIIGGCTTGSFAGNGIVAEKKTSATFTLGGTLGKTIVYVDNADFPLIQKAAAMLAGDIEAATGYRPLIVHTVPAAADNLIIIGSAAQSSLIRKLIARNTIRTISSQWEGYQLQSVTSPLKGIQHLLILGGSDPRGTAFGVFEFSRQIGVSPWNWWADVPVKQRKEIYLLKNFFLSDAPKVKYRGIFINDEAPALSGWSKEKFGGFNHLFYAKVFELMLRLKSNYIWPAMWGNAFYDDDSLNIRTAEEYGIVIGTSHHEPLMRAHDEWRRYGKGKWDYNSNETVLKDFWRKGIERATNEKIVSVGMRGDGDEPMTTETATTLLERIVKDQRSIIQQVTGKPASETPQLWALYKEVQDYYDKGMRVPDDVTLLLCDDNWGNIRKLPKLNEKPRKGGYGIYYHFDYVGDPRNYKWLNTNPIPRVWEQMHMAYEYNAREIWIVNVGDIKPMEFPISFFLDYAWNPEKIGPDDLQKYTEQWSAAQFGNKYAKDIAAIIAKYTKYNGRRKPELLDENTYSLEAYNEFYHVVKDYNDLLAKAEKINDQMAPQYKDAFFQLVLHPVKACANLNEMYYYVALNKKAYKNRYAVANEYADKAKQLYINDSLISIQYNQLNKGKWNHQMDQTHIGYTYWQQPPFNKMPHVSYVLPNEIVEESTTIDTTVKTAQHLIPLKGNHPIFYQSGDFVSIQATHFTRAINAGNVKWKILPDHGREGSAITTFPVTVSNPELSGTSAHLEYDFYTYREDSFRLSALFSPGLNFNNTGTGLRYAISIDHETPQIVSVNKESNGMNTWSTWVANNIIVRTTSHRLLKPGKHVIKYWLMDAGVVLQKIVLNSSEPEESYFGPPETKQH